MARVRFSPWNKTLGYIEQGSNVPVIFKKYLNFGAVSGESGYGIREEGGQVQVKHYGGAWTDIGSGSGTTPSLQEVTDIGASSTNNISVVNSSSLGSEMIVNGTFTGSATGWTLNTGWAYSSNTVVKNANGTANLNNQQTYSSTGLIIGVYYKFTYTISSLTVGSVVATLGGHTFTTASANGTYTENFLCTSNTSIDNFVIFTPTNTARFTLDTVSLKRIIGGTITSGNDVKAKQFNSQNEGLGTTTSDAFIASNSTPSTSGNQQVSPSITKTGQGWKTQTTAGSQAVDFRSYVLPVQGGANPSGIDKTQFRINGGSWTDAYWYDSTLRGLGFAIYPSTAQSNGSAGTTRMVTLNNSGTNTWLDFNFAGTRKSSLGADSQGQMIADTSSNNGFVVRVNGTAFHYLGNGALLTYGYGGFQNGINAGSTNVNTSSLQSSGGLALKVKKMTVSGSLDNSATHWLLDGTNSFVCSGTPTYDCSHWANETECLANDAHGGPCAWSAGSDCSVFNNEYGMGSCSSNPGCSVTTDACTGDDQSTCEAWDDTYGGSCVWNAGNDCSAFNGNESGCSGQTGCSVSSSNSCPSQFDEWSCNGLGGCYWDGMSCTGDNSTCTGTYGAGCSGTYNTGGCTGTYGSGCSGTSSCSGINDSSSCSSESGCTSSYIINGNLPDGELYPDRTYWALNDSSTSADAVLIPYSGQTVNMTTSLTLSNYKDGVHLAYYKDLGDCSIYNSNESTCGSTSGCTQNYGDCSSYGDEISCVADTHCSWNGSSCDGGVYFGSCSGSFVISKNWYVWSRT